MDWQALIMEIISGSARNVLIMAAVLIPIMVLLEIAREKKLVERSTRFMKPLARLFGISTEALLPLLTGLIFGITYGASVIIDAARSGKISGKDLFLVNIFIGTAHAVIEDTAYFAAMGANLFVILTGRLLLAILVTGLAGRLIQFFGKGLDNAATMKD